MNEIIVFLTAMTPVGELRAAIPVGIEVFGMSPLHTYVISVLGNAVPVLVLVFGLGAITRWCDKNVKWCHRILLKVFARTERVFRGRYERYGAVALFLFTMIPLPVTGVWTASVAAVIFKIRPKVAVPAILLGMLTAGIIVTFVTLGAEGAIKFFI
jgi:uncharacterized membrane protein